MFQDLEALRDLGHPVVDLSWDNWFCLMSWDHNDLAVLRQRLPWMFQDLEAPRDLGHPVVDLSWDNWFCLMS